MSMWLAIVLVGLGSYAFRVIPMLLGERMRLSERADATLRHTAVGSDDRFDGAGREGGSPPTRSAPTRFLVGLALATSGTVALLGRSMPWWCCAEE